MCRMFPPVPTLLVVMHGARPFFFQSFFPIAFFTSGFSLEDVGQQPPKVECVLCCIMPQARLYYCIVL